MIIKQPSYRKQISANQIELLALIGKFRFTTIPLVSVWRVKSTSTIYERLHVLTEQGYLHRTYDTSWKLLGKPAVYSLSAKGISVLRKHTTRFSEAVYKNQYKNKSASAQLVDHSIDIAGLCLQLKQQYNDSMQYFSKSEITKFEQFIRPLPDLYLRKDIQKGETPQHYQLEVIPAGIMTWMIRKRINAHQDWFDENNDEDWGFADAYPTLLLLCSNKSTEQRIHTLIDDQLFDFNILTTTRERFTTGVKGVWLQYWDDEDLELSEL